MELLTNIGWVALGGLVLYLGAEWLVKGAAGLARTFGTREIIVGLTVVAYGTSAPELAVSISANLSGSSPLVFGNVIGSCIANMGLILGMTALISPPMVEASLIRREIPVLLVSVVILIPMLYGGVVTQLEALLLFTMALIFTAMTFWASRSVLSQSASDIESSAEAAGAPSGSGLWRLIGITIVGLALLVGGGELFVGGAKGIALYLGMSERLVGLTIVAFGTSLPELAASLVAALRGHSGLAIGNVIGSNIFNIFLVVGAAGMIRDLPGQLSELAIELAFMVGITLLGAFAMRGKRQISRFEGGVFVAIYLVFLIVAALS